MTHDEHTRIITMPSPHTDDNTRRRYFLSRHGPKRSTTLRRKDGVCESQQHARPPPDAATRDAEESATTEALSRCVPSNSANKNNEEYRDNKNLLNPGNSTPDSGGAKSKDLQRLEGNTEAHEPPLPPPPPAPPLAARLPSYSTKATAPMMPICFIAICEERARIDQAITRIRRGDQQKLREPQRAQKRVQARQNVHSTELGHPSPLALHTAKK